MKNKRIEIYAVTDDCCYKNGKYCGCGVKRGVLKDSDCATCKDRDLVGIPYDTAIEKMAIAILKADTPNENNENDELLKLKLNDTLMVKICKIYAEAALNALLEEK